MSVPRRRVLVVGVVLALVAAGAVTWLLLTRDDDAGRLESAVAMAPEGSVRIGWTDWAGLRSELDADLAASSPTAEVQSFLDRGFEADLTSTSALVDSAPVLHERFGFSPATVDWELLAQSEEGAAVIIGLPESFDLDQLESSLEELGYRKPGQDDGVWAGGPDLLTTIGTVTQELGYLTIDRDRHVLVGSDAEATVSTWREDQRGTEVDDSVADVTGQVEGSLSASIYAGDYVCAALAMTQASDADRTRASELIAEAGEVNPLLGYAIAGFRGGDVRVAMAFDSADQARANADSRAKLASGPAPGQGGAFPDRFELGRVEADEKVVTMELDPLPATYVQSDLANGPVLFATC